jgi:hypothetical protein
LFNNESSLKEILFGIWINTPEEKVNKSSMNEQSLNELIEKYKLLIYEKCLTFILKSKKIEMINSPSPDEGVFLLVLFFGNFQCFLEVKLIPNEKEKLSGNSELSQFSNDWLIMKKKSFVNFEQGMTVKMKVGSTDRLMTMRNYITKKYIVSGSKGLQGTSSMSKNNNTQTLKTVNTVSTNKNFKDPLTEIFEEANYDFPLAVGYNNSAFKKNYNNFPRSKHVSNIPTPTKPSIPNQDLRANLMPSSHYNRTLHDDSESLTINSSKGLSVKSLSRKPSNMPLNHQNTAKFNTIDHDSRGMSNVRSLIKK